MKNYPQDEEKILKFWQKNKTFLKSISSRSKNKPFIFYEGPPTANGQPGIHHVLARCFKDLICRYKTMRGFYVKRQAGWDTHGLPVELQVEKELNISGKGQIESLKKNVFNSIEYFNKKCKQSVWKYKDQWEELTKRIGYWLDMDNPYITYETDYIKKVWQVLKKLWDKDLIYKDFKVVPYCPRCGTSLSSHELAQGYKKVAEPSIFIKFKIKNKEFKNTYLLAWTTTPWTLPGNTALAVNKNMVYIICTVQMQGENYILAQSRIEVLKDIDYKIVKKIKGIDLIGLKYEPIYSVNGIAGENKAHQVYSADFVGDDEGTGIVHTAVMYGIDDFKFGDEIGLPKVHTVDEEGKFNKLVPQWHGKFVKSAEKEIIIDLKKRNILFKKQIYEHDYPFCWRCNTPLLYYARNSWFIKMSQLRDQLQKNNEEINWVPSYLKHGRFGQWIEKVKDWALSRDRYWGTPLPIWECMDCDNKEIKINNKKLNKLNDLHRPFIDKLTFKCKCGGTMKRVPYVIDCWFDSGAMPYASNTAGFPADYICEAIDQTRGWFYTLLAQATALNKGAPYKNVISLGHVLDGKGEKMSKSKGNIIIPKDIIDKTGVDALRWFFYTVNKPGLPKRLRLKDVEEKQRKVLATLWNSWRFYNMYSTIKERTRTKENILDKWLKSRLNETILKVTKKLDDYNIYKSAILLEEFINDLSNWYIRRSRDEFNSKLLQEVLIKICQVMAPYTPFISEQLWQEMKNKKSIHLSKWPQADKKLINKKLNKDMGLVRDLAQKGLAKRAQAQIKIRQPLNKFSIFNCQFSKNYADGLISLLQEELNVKKVVFKKDNKGFRTELDIKITPKLKKQGQERELIRTIQKMRRQAGLQIGDEIILYYPQPKKINQNIKKAVWAKRVKQGEIRVEKI